MQIECYYYKFARLTAFQRATNNISSEKRLDCILFNDPTHRLKGFNDSNGMLYMYVASLKNLVSAHKDRMPYVSLIMANKNFTGLYFDEWQNRNLCYGNPDPNDNITHSNDLYLVKHSKNLTEIEILIVPNEKNSQNILYQFLIDGELDQLYDAHRMKAQSYYQYI